MDKDEQVATKTDLADLKADLKADLRDLELRLDARFEGRMDAQEQRLRDHVGDVVRDSETRMLQAFYSFAETNNRRLVQTEAGDVVLATRVATLEGRVLEIEKRLNLPAVS